MSLLKLNFGNLDTIAFTITNFGFGRALLKLNFSLVETIEIIEAGDVLKFSFGDTVTN